MLAEATEITWNAIKAMALNFIFVALIEFEC